MDGRDPSVGARGDLRGPGRVSAGCARLALFAVAVRCRGIGGRPGRRRFVHHESGAVRCREQRTTAIVVGLVVLVLIAGAIGFAIESQSKSSHSANTSAPAPSTTKPAVPLSQVVVRQADVRAPRQVLLLPDGQRTNQPTLDLCNGTFASEEASGRDCRSRR